MNNLTKRIVSVILAMIMILGTLSAVAAEGNYPFSDFPDGWSKESMEAAVDNGLLTGMGDGTIAPKDNLTRAQMAAIINRAFGAEIAADISGFTDVPEDAWYRDDIALAVNMQTFTGEGNGVMNPEADITRQEAFAVLARALVIETNKSVVSDFSDGGEISSWAVGDVSALVANGYVNGYPDGTLDPLGNITREEFAQVMHNIFKTYISEEGTVDSVNDGGVMINKPGVTLRDVTVNGDLVLGDGVGKGSVTLENVKILGRILCRGGEDKVTIKDTTTTGGVVVKDVNGVVNFNNYRSEPVFDGVREITRATYLTPLSDDEIHVGPSRRPSSSSTEEKTVKIYEDSTLSSLIKTVKIEKGSKLFSDLPSDPSRTGYIFDGWYYNEGGTEKKVDSSTIVNTNMTVYGKWKPASGTLYTVKHVKQNIDGTYTTLVETETLSGTTGGTTAAAAKTYEGFTAESFSQSTIAADGSTVVEIKYKRNEYTVKFESNGGSAVADVSALYEAPVTKPADPTKAGYRFVDWYADSALTTPFDFSKMPLGGATVYAKWASSDDVIYTVRHVRQNIDGTYPTSGALLEEQKLTGTTGGTTAAAAKTYEGFTAESFAQSTIAADGSTVVEIKYKRNEYTVKFESNGGSAVADVSALYEAPVTKPANPTRAGYKFVDWYVDSALTTPFDFSKMPLGGATVYARWVTSDQTIYTVRHVRQNIDGTYPTSGALLEEQRLTGTTGAETAAAAKTYEGFTAESFTQKTIAADDSTVVEIRYKRNTYTVKFDSKGGSAVADVSALYEAPVTKPADPTLTGYTFEGWFADEAYNTPFDFSKMPLGGATVYAKWRANGDTAYTVRHVRQNIDGTYTTLVETETKYGVTGAQTAAAAKTYDGFTAESFAQGTIASDGSTVVEIKYKRNTYTVKYYKDSALTYLLSSEDVLYEASAAAIPAAPAESGKVFKGWYYIDSELGETVFDGSVKIKGNTEVYAKWTNMYSVSFYMDETLTKPEIRVIQVEGGSKLTVLPADPTKDNCDFDGWAYIDGGVEKTFDVDVIITSDIDVYAKWKLKKYTVYFYNEYSAAPDASILEGTYEAEYGTTVPETEIPDSYENSGYVKNSSVDPVYTTEYKHKIPNEWWYFDAESGEWKIFDDTVPVKSDINVFDMTKNVSFMFNTGRLSTPVSVTVPYNSHTRLADTFKDILYAGRNSVKYALDNTDVYNKLIAKLADPKLGIIDEHGNILNQKLDIGIYEIISSSEIEVEIRNYLRTLVKNGGEDLKSVLAFVSVPELVSAVGTDTIIDYVDNDKLFSMIKLASMRATFVEFMKDEFVNDASFRNETVAALTNILANDDEAMLSLAAYVRAEYNSGNPEVVNFVNNTMGIPDISYVDNDTLAAAMKTQASSMPEFMAQYIIYRISMNDPKIDECVNKFIDNDMDAAFVGRIKTILTHDSRIESIINKYLDENSAEAETLIVDYVDSLSDAKKEELSDKIFDKISGQSTYKNFIKAFEDKTAEFEVTPDSVSFLLGVANAVNSYTYEGLRDKFRVKFGSLIDLIGEETVKTYFNSAKHDYYNGAVALAEQIKADKLAGTAGTYSYKTSLTFRANLMRDILVPKYRSAVSKIADKLKSKEQVKYNDNVYLKALVEKDMIAALFDTSPADEFYSGYKLKDNPMEYYDLMYAMVVLADDAVLYYDYVDYDTAFEKITPYAVKIMNKFIAVVDHFDKTGELPGGLDSKLSSISKIGEFYGAFEEMLGAAADEILASSIKQNYTEEDFKNQSIKAATGFINLMLKQFNGFAENGKLPFKADALVERVSKINELYKKYGSDAQELAKKLAEFNFNHAYTEGEVASYEEYVKHVYTLLNEAEDPAFSVDDMYDIIDVFFGDILDKLEFTPDDAEGVINLDGYKAEAKGSEASVIRFYR